MGKKILLLLLAISAGVGAAIIWSHNHQPPSSSLSASSAQSPVTTFERINNEIYIFQEIKYEGGEAVAILRSQSTGKVITARCIGSQKTGTEMKVGQYCTKNRAGTVVHRDVTVHAVPLK